MMNRSSVCETLGYCANLATIFLFSRTLPIVFESHVPDSTSGMALVFSACGVITFFALALRGFATNPLRYGAAIFSTLCLLSGLGVVIATLVFGQHDQTAMLFCAAMFGFGSACSFTLWQQILYSEKLERSQDIIAIGTALAAMVMMVSLLWSEVALLFLLAICVLLNVVLILKNCSTIKTNFSKHGMTIAIVNVRTAFRLFVSIWKYVVCIGVIGFTQRVSASMTTDATASYYMYLAYSISTIVAIPVLILIWKRSAIRLSFNAFYSFIIIIVAAAFIPTMFLGYEYTIFIAVLTNLAFTLVSMFMVITSIRIAKSRDVNPTMVFGMFAGLVYLITSISSPILVALDSIQGKEGLPLVVVGSMLIIYCLSLTGALIVLSNARNKQDVDYDILKPSQVSQAPIKLLKRDVALQQDMIPDCCEELKKRYKLTDRQAETLELIARGRDVIRIADALCVSYHTARSHCRNLYTKLGVHKRQDILDMLEEIKESLDG